MDVKIAVAYHKESPVVSHPSYLPLHVGKAMNPNVELDMQTDADGDNISAENGYYCELTGLYWLWKNVKADVKGLFHYRRIPDVGGLTMKQHFKQSFHTLLHHSHVARRVVSLAEFEAVASRTAAAIPQLLECYDIIAAGNCRCYPNVVASFGRIGDEYIDILRRAVTNLHPSHLEILDCTLASRKMFYANMVVMKTPLHNEYCNFLFSTLEEVKRLLLAERWLVNLAEERIFSRKLGYLAELLTNSFICEQRRKSALRVKELPIVMLK
ncbi:MAG: DUF4422 domain-containing protein [Firmicutes bacterium]|nr:DUF4422 domain-containing protein [Bacillota bacterium]MCM1401278.1 DUF4422 domain-containing protein [Bacteroides sp.]MCM1476767.1 DUF4422 domain-containing protein [Bacteroides sp.]